MSPLGHLADVPISRDRCLLPGPTRTGSRGERLALGFQFHIAKSREDGMNEAAKHYEENMKMFG
jgi:hypothetical protein